MPLTRIAGAPEFRAQLKFGRKTVTVTFGEGRECTTEAERSAKSLGKKITAEDTKRTSSDPMDWHTFEVAIKDDLEGDLISWDEVPIDEINALLSMFARGESTV